MNWMLILITVWVVVAVAAALVLGRGIRLADRESAAAVGPTIGWDPCTEAEPPATPARDLVPPGEDAALRREPVPAVRARSVPALHRRAVRGCITASERSPVDRQRGRA